MIKNKGCYTDVNLNLKTNQKAISNKTTNNEIFFRQQIK